MTTQKDLIKSGPIDRIVSELRSKMDSLITSGDDEDSSAHPDLMSDLKSLITLLNQMHLRYSKTLYLRYLFNYILFTLIRGFCFPSTMPSQFKVTKETVLELLNVSEK